MAVKALLRGHVLPPIQWKQVVEEAESEMNTGRGGTITQETVEHDVPEIIDAGDAEEKQADEDLSDEEAKKIRKKEKKREKKRAQAAELALQHPLSKKTRDCDSSATTDNNSPIFEGACADGEEVLKERDVGSPHFGS